MNKENQNFGTMQAVVNSDGFATVGYLAAYSDSEYKPASKEEFLRGYDLDHLLGSNGDALEEGEIIECSDGIIQVCCDIEHGFYLESVS